MSATVPSPPACVFLDRDGVINEEAGIISRREQLRLIPGSGSAIARLNERGVPVIVITNQPVVARGWLTEEGVVELHDHLRDLLAQSGAKLDAIYFCPHHENADDPAYRMECECRKPRPGLLHRAAADHGLDLARCVMIGDRTVDLKAGREAGCSGILVETGFAGGDGKCEVTPDHVAADLAAAVDFLLSCPTPPKNV